MLKSGMIIKRNGQLGKVVEGTDEGTFHFLPLNYGRFWCRDLEVITVENVLIADHNEKIEYYKQDFTWGVVEKVHEIADFMIFEYSDVEDNKKRFHPFINFRDTSNTFISLERALLACIVFKNVGFNSRLESYIPKMIYDENEITN